MKNTTCKKSFWNQPCVPYPNAATRRQVADRILEGLLVFAAGAGLGAAVLLGMVLA